MIIECVNCGRQEDWGDALPVDWMCYCGCDMYVVVTYDESGERLA